MMIFANPSVPPGCSLSERSEAYLSVQIQRLDDAIQVSGKKVPTGRTDLEIEISNQCARLVAKALVF